MWYGIEDRKESAAISWASLSEATRVTVPGRRSCPSGHKGCAYNVVTQTDWIMTCNVDWQWGYNCSPDQKCVREGDNVAMCVHDHKKLGIPS